MSVDAATEPSPAQLDTAAAAVHYRYPGSPPFQDTELDRRLFRGRAEEADTVLHSILSSDLFLLYAVSGMGKTSLLNAAVMHRLRERGHWPVSVRLNDTSKRPVAGIREQIEDAAEADPEIELVWGPGAEGATGPDASLWDLLASLELWRHNDLQRPVIVFDQFEELFTLGWDEADREEFIGQFGEVVRRHRLHGAAAPNGRGAAPDAKFVLVIREDHLGELEALATDVPQIMRNRFRLGALDPVQAAAAIREPARVRDGRLDSQPFVYTEAAIDEILDFLRTTTERGEAVRTNRVDPPQLQIVCQYVERAILPAKGAPAPGDVVQIDAADLGGKQGLERILGDFYRRTLQTFPASQQQAVRHLCERGLINPTGRRLSLEEGEIETEFGVTPVMLYQLVDERLLRADPRVGSIYYELAHDTLVPPIRTYADEDRAQRRRRRRRWLAVGAAAVGVLAVLVVSLLAYTIGSSDSSDTPGSVRLALGQTLRGSVDVPGGDVRYTVQAADDEALLARVRPVAGTGAEGGSGPSDAGGGLNAAIQLTTGDGAKRQQDQLGAGQAEQMVVAPVSAESQELLVTSFDSTTGAFEITLEEIAVTDVSAGSIELGGIQVPGALAVFRIEISGGSPRVIDITPSQGPDPGDDRGQDLKQRLDIEAEMVDPAGVGTRIDSYGPGSAERVQVSGIDGQYLIVVRGYQSTVGQFSLEASEVSRVLTSEQPETGEIDGSDVAEFTVEVAADTSHVVAVTPDPDFDPILAVVGPEGRRDPIDNGGDGGTEVAVLGPAAGRYLLTVSGFDSSSGRFTVETGQVDRTLASGQPEAGEVGGSDVVALTFTIADGDPPVMVTLQPDPGFDPILDIVDPSGTIQSFDGQIEGGPEEALLDAPGTHLLVVRGFSSSTGTFELLATPVEPQPLSPGDTATGTGVAVYDLEVTGGEDLRVVVEPSSPDTFVEIEVNDPAGFPIDIVTGDLGAAATVEIEDQDGVHRLIVRSYGEPRDFTVTVTGELDSDGDD
jgi:hypothetical protein